MQVYYTYFSEYLALPECPLSQYRRSKLSKIHNPEVARKEIITEFFLMKCLLSENNDLARPLNIQTNEYGKPFIPNSGIEFSISHSGNLLVIATDTNSIGIDCENSEEKHNYKRISEKYFCDEEKCLIDNYDSFLEIWTKKEAYAKCLGIPVIQILSKNLNGLNCFNHLLKDSYHITICRSL